MAKRTSGKHRQYSAVSRGRRKPAKEIMTDIPSANLALRFLNSSDYSGGGKPPTLPLLFPVGSETL